MIQKNFPPKEGDVYTVVTIENYTFELRYGYNEDYERNGEPFVLYPDLESNLLYTKSGFRIVSAIQSTCENYKAFNEKSKEDACYTCDFYSDRNADVGICQCKKMCKGVCDET